MNDPQRRAAFVTSVSVAEAFAGRGVGRALLDRCITRARSDGFAELRLEVSPRAEAALALYRRAGFVETERRADVLSMLLPLATHEEPR
jgi:ribosomal protein S18 acetylase RimI-like enzyme